MHLLAIMKFDIKSNCEMIGSSLLLLVFFMSVYLLNCVICQATNRQQDEVSHKAVAVCQTIRGTGILSMDLHLELRHSTHHILMTSTIFPAVFINLLLKG